MKVYPVLHWHLHGDQEETNIVAIFSAQYLAQEYIRSLNYHRANQDYYWEEFMVQNSIPKGE